MASDRRFCRETSRNGHIPPGVRTGCYGEAVTTSPLDDDAGAPTSGGGIAPDAPAEARAESAPVKRPAAKRPAAKRPAAKRPTAKRQPKQAAEDADAPGAAAPRTPAPPRKPAVKRPSGQGAKPRSGTKTSAARNAAGRTTVAKPPPASAPAPAAPTVEPPQDAAAPVTTESPTVEPPHDVVAPVTTESPTVEVPHDVVAPVATEPPVTAEPVADSEPSGEAARVEPAPAQQPDADPGDAEEPAAEPVPAEEAPVEEVLPVEEPVAEPEAQPVEEPEAPTEKLVAAADPAPEIPIPRPEIPPALVLRGVSRSYGGTPAVAGIDLTVPAGSFYGLVGPNGAGKTTTMSMIAGLLRPDRGEITVSGIDLRKDPRAAKALLGVLPDRLRTFDRLTGRQLLYYFGVLRGLKPDVVAQRTADLARAFDLTDALGRVVSDYSAGMTKKVMLAGAMIHSPRLLVLDEPFEAVDPVSSANILEILSRYVSRGGTVLLSSHGMDLIERVCSRVAVIVAGQLLAEGTVDEVRGELTLEQRFVELSGEVSSMEGLEWLHTFSD